MSIAIEHIGHVTQRTLDRLAAIATRSVLAATNQLTAGAWTAFALTRSAAGRAALLNEHIVDTAREFGVVTGPGWGGWATLPGGARRCHEGLAEVLVTYELTGAHAVRAVVGVAARGPATADPGCAAAAVVTARSGGAALARAAVVAGRRAADAVAAFAGHAVRVALASAHAVVAAA